MQKLFFTTKFCLVSGVAAILLYCPAESFTVSPLFKKALRDTSETPGAKQEKVEHAEPLYADLIRDLGTLQGEAEWNAGFGVNDEDYEGFIEYEFAPIDRLGVEVELPFGLYDAGAPVGSWKNTIESLKTGLQWSFFVSEEAATSMALGYSNELLFHMPESPGGNFLKGNAYNPFVIAAKRWSDSFHSLVMAGAEFTQDFSSKEWHTEYQVNTSFQYMISGSRNFVGVELNKVFADGDFGMDIRPQANLALTENLLIGVMAGIPVNSDNKHVSTFFRFIYEMEE